ncbi:unnamed protein product [Haemonchus placei]|uniref:Transmembrane protein n=1 Tax=Haemonchus placei TaxID=6290 RepID=A0A0N4X170_HAEPC|nr:unnamed protein product [Haemonchus placei]
MSKTPPVFCFSNISKDGEKTEIIGKAVVHLLGFVATFSIPGVNNNFRRVLYKAVTYLNYRAHLPSPIYNIGKTRMTMRLVFCLTLFTVLIAVNHYVEAKKLYVQLPPDVPGGEPRYVKAPKVMTEYDKCKMECKRQRSASYRKEHITALREQLAILEAEEVAAASDIKESMVRQQERQEVMNRVLVDHVPSTTLGCGFEIP